MNTDFEVMLILWQSHHRLHPNGVDSPIKFKVYRRACKDDHTNERNSFTSKFSTNAFKKYIFYIYEAENNGADIWVISLQWHVLSCYPWNISKYIIFENLYKYTDIRRAGSEYHPFTAELISFSEANYFMEALKYLMRA